MPDPGGPAYVTDVVNTPISIAYVPGGVSMPYATIADLPTPVKALPAHGQAIYRAAFNAAYTQYSGDESCAHATAWAAVKHTYAQDAKTGAWTAVSKILKIDAPLRYSLGVVYEPDAIDSQGDFARAPAIQKACWDFSRELQKNAAISKGVLSVLHAIRKALDERPEVRVDVTDLFAVLHKDFKGLGDQHTDWPEGLGEIVENYIAPVSMNIEGEQVAKGSWLMGCIWNAEAFTKVQSGERTGWSMGGLADRLLDREVA